MAERAVNDPIHANLDCPLCFSIFENATLLTCGHTFCQKCLIGYDMGHQDMNHMICPLCRGQTPFGENRVQGLPRNVTVNALVSDIQANMLPEKGLAQPQTPTIIKEVALPGGIRGMTSMAQDTVVVGYGSSFPGAEAIKVSGERKPYLSSDVGSVRDIVILNDGRAVVSHGSEEIKAYDSEGTMWVIPFNQLAKKETLASFCTLNRDSQDNVYIVNGTDIIQNVRVHGKGMTNNSGVITTGTVNGTQICVTQTEILVIRLSKTNPRSLAFFDKKGNVGSIVPARDENEVLCATVDALDRVIIGYFSPLLGTLTLSVCTLTGLHIKHQYFFSELHFSPGKQIWCNMVSITPKLLAFAHLDKKLYFIKVPPIPKTWNCTM